MKKKFTLFLCSMLFSIGTFAQGWVKPEAPAMMPLTADTECYLYNADADGFYLGANEYLTRASYDTVRGYKVYVKEDNRKGEFDGKSYLIQCYIEDGWNAGNSLYLYITDVNNIWIDQAIDGTNDKSFVFVKQDDSTFLIGLSDQNSDFKEEGGYEEVYLGAKNDTSDTRLYLIDTNDEKDGLLRWYFVTPENYTKYITAKKQYLAAVKLGELIEEAKGMAGVDVLIISAAEGAYADLSSSEETLNSQADALANAIQMAKENQASVDNPVEMLAIRGFGTDFTDGDVKGWTSTISAQNKQASNGNAAANYSQTGNHYENWNGSAFGTGTISVTATDLPTGVYRFNALAFANETGGTYLFAGDAQTLVNSTQIDINQSYEVVTFVSEGSLKVGLDVQVKGPNWVGLDNAGLYFVGSGDDALTLLKEQTLANEPEFFDFCQKSVADTYDMAKNALNDATDVEAMKTAYPAYMAALKAKKTSCDAYAQFYEKYMEVEDFINEYGSTYAGDDMDILIDYMEADDIEPNELYLNGSAAYFLQNGTLDSSTILKEIDFMVSLRNNAVANSMRDGDDVTNLILNPHFKEDGVWTKVGLPEWPLGPDDYKLAQAYSIVFNVYQDLEGLQNGLYELTLNDFYRPANYGASEYGNFRAYVYMNGDEAKMNSIESGAAKEQSYSSDYSLDDGTYVPNDVNGAAEAFKAGRYQQKVYGIVTDGKMRIGVRTNVRYEGCWGAWSDFHLTFRAKNVEVTKDVLAASMPKAEELLSNKCGQDELSALSAAIEAANSASDDNVYDALVDLKNAMAAVEECTDSYTSLNLALNTLAEAIDQNPSSSKIGEASSLFEEVTEGYNNGTYDNEAATEKATEVSEMAVAIKIGETTEDVQDMTSLIVNPTFDPSRGSKDAGTIEGWTTTSMNGYKQYSVSYNRAPFELYQDLQGLPKGRYRVTVHTYYRAGYYNEEADRIANGEETHLTTLYAQTATSKVEKKVKNLIEDADAETFDVNCYTYDNGLHAPDGTTPTVAWFAKGKYLNYVDFYVGDDGKVRIGLSKTETYANDYEVVGAWTLTYLGDNDRTSLIVNPTFDPSRGSKDAGTIEGWTTTSMNGYKQYSVSYNRAPFELYQDLEGLPKGKYLVKVHTYYRAGYYNEEVERIESGIDTKLTTLYAETSTGKVQTKVKNLIDDADAETFDVNCYTYDNGLHAPDGTTPTVAWFAKGKYLNELEFYVGDDGKARIGLSKKETFANDYEVVGAWELYYLGDDRSSLIVNPTFDPSRGSKDAGTIEGWTTTSMNGYKQYSVSYNRAPFHLYQDIEGLPAGLYEVTVHTYYRAGYYNEEYDRIESGVDTKLTTLYTETSKGREETKVKNLIDDADTETYDVNCYTYDNGLHAPDGTTPTVAWFAKGKYLNSLQFEVPADGKVRIGLKKDETFANDYEVVGAWNLYYLGLSVDQTTGVEDIKLNPNADGGKVSVVGIYNLSGMRIETPQPGINILRMSDGTSRKILVK